MSARMSNRNSVDARPAGRKAYRRPELIGLGSLRDMTLTSSNSGANDGMPNMGTKRGGDFQRWNCRAS